MPTYPTVVGQTVVDGGVTWVCKGRGVFAFDFANPSWSAATITARTVVIYKDTGTAATSPLVGFDTFAADVTSTGAAWTYQVAAVGFVLSSTTDRQFDPSLILDVRPGDNASALVSSR